MTACSSGCRRNKRDDRRRCRAPAADAGDTAPADHRPALIVTCNQPFSAWEQIFPDPAMTVAAIDRLVHHATILEFNTESYRRRTALAAAEQMAG
jgi:IstB-like ATP binding protein